MDKNDIKFKLEGVEYDTNPLALDKLKLHVVAVGPRKILEPMYHDFVSQRYNCNLADCVIECGHITTNLPRITRVIFSVPATICFWSDGTKTVVKKNHFDKWNTHFAILASIRKKFRNSELEKEIDKMCKTYLGKRSSWNIVLMEYGKRYFRRIDFYEKLDEIIKCNSEFRD